MFKKRLGALLLCAALLIGLLAGCGGNPSEEGGTTLLFGDCDWESNRFHNALAMYIVETVYEVETEEMRSSSPIIWESMKSDGEGDIDILLEAWSENFATYDEDISSGALLELSVNFDDNFQGFYVPRYIVEGDPSRGIEAVAPDLKTVKDLAKYPEVFTDPEDPEKGVIYSGIAGWYVSEVCENKYKAYGLDEMYNLTMPGSEAAMTASIVSAYETGTAWCGYYWEPTWITGKYDLYLLQDDPYDADNYRNGMSAFPANRVTVCMANSAAEEYPEVAAFLKNYKTSSALTSSALAYMEDTKADYTATAKWFIGENPDLIRGWLASDEEFNKLMESLA